MLAKVEAYVFLFFTNSQGNDRMADCIQSYRANYGKWGHNAECKEMVYKGFGLSVNETYRVGEDGCENHANDSADSVAGENVQGVIE